MAELPAALAGEALAACPAGIALADARQADLPLVYVNPAFLDLTGYSETEVLGHNCRFLQGPETGDGQRRELAAAIAAGRGTTVEILNYRRDGARFWNYLELTPVRAADGTLTHYLGTQRDVTQRKAAEEANRVKAAFLANMSHEIRTPLNAIVGAASALQAGELNARQHRRAATLTESADMLVAIVNDILDFAKLEAGQLSIERHVFAPAYHLRQAADQHRRAAEAKGLGFKLFVDDTVPAQVVGDYTRLRQIASNFIANAVKYTQAGEVRTTLELADPHAGTPELLIQVTDTGPGIPAERQEAVFRPYGQAHDSGEIASTGLGLSIAQGIAQAMGGAVGFASTPGAGSTFWARLPMAPAEAAQAPAETGPERAAPSRPAGASAQPRLLVAEDVASNRTILAELLAELGLEAAYATDGRQAVERALAEPFDLILMDLRMPGLDGLAATRELHPRAAAPPPVIALTADIANIHRDQARQAGLADYLTKPVTVASLGAMLARWLPAPVGDAPQAAEAPAAGAAGLDLSFVARLAAKDPAKAATFARKTLADLESRLGPLEDAVARGQPADAAELAHAMKAVASQAGAYDLAETLRGVESAAHKAGPGAALDCPELGRLRGELDRLRAVLKPYGDSA